MDEDQGECDATDEFILKMAHSSNNLFPGNSFELNSATLSDDSGFVPHTNSSISSGSSRGVGLCRFEFELAESDAEVSQFDSLDNFSDGGMSAENFNTLKKGPFLEPPPEFQDSPQTTMQRSSQLQNYSFRLTKAIITNAITDLSTRCRPYFDTSSSSGQTTIAKKPNGAPGTPGGGGGGCLRHGTSDSFLTQYDGSCNNIYDVPNSEFYDNHLLYVNKAVHQHHTMTTQEQIYDDDDLYYFRKRNLTPVDSYKRRRTPTSSLLYSPLHHHHHHYYYHTGSSSGNRPNSRNSLNSRLSSSHNSLSVPTTKADDTIFITQAMSHDALVGREISDMYNVPIDSDIYALPVDSVCKAKQSSSNSKSSKSSSQDKPRKSKFTRNNKRRRRNLHPSRSTAANLSSFSDSKRHSVPENRIEPLHMTLDEVKRYYHTLYSSSSEGSEILNNTSKTSKAQSRKTSESRANKSSASTNATKPKRPKEKLPIIVTVSPEASKSPTPAPPATPQPTQQPSSSSSSSKKSQFSITFNLRQKFCNIFRFRSSSSHKNRLTDSETLDESNIIYNNNNIKATPNSKEDSKKIQQLSSRALPPLPPPAPADGSSSIDAPSEDSPENQEEQQPSTSQVDADQQARYDFAANIEKVKEYGWYWGPISSETAEKILSNEPDGSFIVRDSSDDHYIFSLTFKIAGCVRHVRIDQDQGTFSFGSCVKFKSRTIVEFIENAVMFSRSGRYLFFLNRRPEHGRPMRIKLLEPVSRFKRIQSLQHMCRFVIRKAVVRKDLIQTLPLPRRILDYLSYKNCFAEQIESDSSSQSQLNGKNNNEDSN